MVREVRWAVRVIYTVLMFLAVAGVGFGEGAVEFGDISLKVAVERELGKENPSAEDMLQLTRISQGCDTSGKITSLKGLEFAKNLKSIHLYSCSIDDFSVLAQLPELEELTFDYVEITDIFPIVSAIESHPSLRQISLRANRISDISSLLKLKSQTLRKIDLKDNPLNEDAYKIVIPQLRKNIRGIQVFVPFQAVQLVRPAVFFVLFVIAGVLAVIRNWKQKGWLFELISGVLSAGVGCFLGLGAQFLYVDVGEMLKFYGNGYENPMWVGGVAGGAFGLLAGVWFAQFLRGLLVWASSRWVMLGKGILSGIGLGILCSVAVHAILMMAYRNLDLRPMLIGAGFGLGAGIVAGLVLAGCFIVGYKKGLIKGKEKV